MNKGFKLVLIMCFIVCSSLFVSAGWVRPKMTSQVTSNGTFYDSAKSFALVDFADSCSVVSSSDVYNLSCTSGDVSFLRYNVSSDVWSLSCCLFKTSKCHWYNVSTMTNFTENYEFGNNLNIEVENGVEGTMCCNSQMSQCYFKKFNLSCDVLYDNIIVSLSYSNLTTNWSVTTCISGFV